MDRRYFLATTVFGFAALTMPGISSCNGDIGYDKSIAKEMELSLICETGTMINIGKNYRLRIANENSERKLVKLLIKDINSNKDAILLAIKEDITKDFETGKTIIIDGWILSVTEARQCALLSYLQTKK